MAGASTTSCPTGGYSRKALGLDGRTRQARELAAARDRILASLDQPPCPAAVALAERLAVVSLHLAAADRRGLAQQGLSEAEARSYATLAGLHASLTQELHCLVRPAGTAAAA